MAQQIHFDTQKLTERETQLVNALLSTHMTFRAGLLRAGGMSSSDPNFQSMVQQFALAFMQSAFPDLNFRVEET